MTSPKQIKANQNNSKKSTGPKSDRGKSAVSKNALKHGLLSSETFFDWENHDDFSGLRTELHKSLKPIGSMEQILVDRLVSLTWRLKRVGRIETGIYCIGRYSLQHEMASAELSDYLQNKTPINRGIFQKIEANVNTQEALDLTVKNMIDVALVESSDMPELSRIFIQNESAFANLNRYETGIERSLYKALHELQRLQAARQGKAFLQPIALDINNHAEL